MADPKTKTKLDKILGIVDAFHDDSAITRKDLTEVVGVLTEYLKRLGGAANEGMKNHRTETDNAVLHLTTHLKKTRRMIALAADKNDVKKIADSLQKSVNTVTKRLNELKIPEEADFSDIQETINGLTRRVEAWSILPEAIRDALETLEGDDRLDVSAIKGWDDFMDEIRGIATSARGLIVAQQRGQVKMYDLSDQLDGVKTTFALPAFGRVINVQCTSSPIVFRPTVDYTVDGKLMKITFTNQIFAATSLSAGQTLIVLYAEN